MGSKTEAKSFRTISFVHCSRDRPLAGLKWVEMCISRGTISWARIIAPKRRHGSNKSGDEDRPLENALITAMLSEVGTSQCP